MSGVDSSSGSRSWSGGGSSSSISAGQQGPIKVVGDGGREGEGEGGGRVEHSSDPLPANIMHAAYVGALELVKSMVEGGTPADGQDALQGSTPLHWACFGGHLDVARWLVKTAGADANKPNNDGCTPLFFACEKGHLGVAQWLVREAGAQVNVRDNIQWQTPLHRVCLRARGGGDDPAVGTELEDFILWLVEAGADLTAVDRFGNHVEDLAVTTTPRAVLGSKLCDMIAAAREEGVPDAETREKLRRRNTVKKKSAGEMSVQLSPKLEAKQRIPLSRRGSRNLGSSPDLNGSRQTSLPPGGESGGGGTSGNGSVAGLSRPESQTSTSSAGGDGGGQGGGGRGGELVREAPGVEAAVPAFTLAAGSADSELGPRRGSSGDTAAPVGGAGIRMIGGGPSPPSAAGSGAESSRNTQQRNEVLVPGAVGGQTPSDGSATPAGPEPLARGQEQQARRRRSSERKSRGPSLGGSRDDELQQQESLRVAEEALRKTEAEAELRERQGDASAVEAQRRLDGAAQEVVDRIRELAAERKAGEISDHEFAEQKRQLLEMEHLRREAEEEARRRAQGQAEDDAGAGILTSVGQNTPPPSPKRKKNGSRNDSGNGDDSDDDTPVQIAAAAAAAAVVPAKDMRETYKPSDIERYTNHTTDGPRVFGEVPDSVKESLAAKEAQREAAAAAARKANDETKKLKSKKSASKLSKGRGSESMDTAVANTPAGGGGAMPLGDVRESLQDADVNQSSGGCRCVIM